MFQKFTWPLARQLEEDEVLTIHLMSHSRFLGNRVLGSFALVLQQVVADGRVNLTETLVDVNHKELPVGTCSKTECRIPMSFFSA